MSSILLLSALASIGAPGSLDGRWARLQVTTAVSELPVVGEIESVTEAVVLLDIRDKGGGFLVTEEVCFIETRTSGGVETSYPPAFVRAVSGGEKEARLRRVDGRDLYEELPKVELLGFVPKRNEEEALPDDAGDPSVVDGDGDGKPGLTVRVDGPVGGEVQVVSRRWSRLEGKMRSPSAIQGTMYWNATQKVLDASSRFLRFNPESTPHPDPDKNWFRMRRVPQQATCRQVLDRRRVLFGR